MTVINKTTWGFKRLNLSILLTVKDKTKSIEYLIWSHTWAWYRFIKFNFNLIWKRIIYFSSIFRTVIFETNSELTIKQFMHIFLLTKRYLRIYPGTFLRRIWYRKFLTIWKLCLIYENYRFNKFRINEIC